MYQNLKATQRKTIDQAKRLKHRNNLHSVGWFDYYDLQASKGYALFIDYIENGLEIPKDKLNSFRRALNPVLPTFSLTNEIYRSASEIFAAEDRVIISEDKDVEKRVFNFVKSTAFNAARNDGSSYVFVTSEEGSDDYTLEIIDIDSLVCVKQNRNTSDQLTVEMIAWEVMYKEECITIAVDTERVVWYDANDTVIKDEPHNIGYCPVFPILQNAIKEGDNISRANIDTSQISAKDDYLFWATSNKIAGTTDFFPVTWSYPFDQVGTLQNTFEQGINNLKSAFENVDNIIDDEEVKFNTPDNPNPEKKFRGASTHVEKPIPNADEGETDVGDPFGYINPSHEQSNYRAEAVERLRDNILTQSVGVSDTSFQDVKDVREMAIEAKGANRHNILMEYKVQFEVLIGNLIKTVIRHVDGKDTDVYVNLGEKFAGTNSKTIVERVKENRTAGVSESKMLEILKEQIVVDNKNHPTAKQVQELIYSIEPFPTVTLSEFMSWQNVTQREVLEKKYFAQFVNEVEYEVKMQNLTIASITRKILIDRFKTYIDGKQDTTSGSVEGSPTT